MFDLQVPKGWKLVKLSDLGEVNRGRSRHRPRDADHLYGGSYPFVQTGDIKASGGRVTNYTQTYSEAGLAQSRLWPKDTMCITIAANIAETGILQFPACFPDSVIGFIPDKTQCNVYFIEYVFRLLRRQIQAQATGSVQDNINLQTLERLLFPVPELEEQNRIADVLCSFDDKIELNRQTNQTLEQIAQALFKSWFVDFDPVKAKIAAKQAGGNAEQIERAAMAAISGKTEPELNQLTPEQYTNLKTTAALFPDKIVDSELGEIPLGWQMKPFGDLLSRTIGGDWGKDERDEKHTEKVKILRGTDLPNVYNGNDTRVPTRFVEPKKLATRKLEAGDIVIEVSGGSPTQPTGRSLFLTEELITRLEANLEPASFCRLFRPVDKESGLLLGFHLAIIYEEGKTWLYQNQSTGISNFQTKVFLEKEHVVVPSEKIKNAFYEIAMPYLQKMSSSENKNLGEIRDTLLPKLLSGELLIESEDVA